MIIITPGDPDYESIVDKFVAMIESVDPDSPYGEETLTRSRAVLIDRDEQGYPRTVWTSPDDLDLETTPPWLSITSPAVYESVINVNLRANDVHRIRDAVRNKDQEVQAARLEATRRLHEERRQQQRERDQELMSLVREVYHAKPRAARAPRGPSNTSSGSLGI